jgi:hypothetical protein
MQADDMDGQAIFVASLDSKIKISTRCYICVFMELTFQLIDPAHGMRQQIESKRAWHGYRRASARQQPLGRKRSPEGRLL